MSVNRWSTKRDRNEPPIRKALSAVGAQIILLDPFDMLVLFRGQITMLEVKTPKGRPTRNQELLVEYGWPVHFVRTPEEALEAIGAGHGHEVRREQVEHEEKTLARRDTRCYSSVSSPPRPPTGDK